MDYNFSKLILCYTPMHLVIAYGVCKKSMMDGERVAIYYGGKRSEFVSELFALIGDDGFFVFPEYLPNSKELFVLNSRPFRYLFLFFFDSKWLVEKNFNFFVDFILNKSSRSFSLFAFNDTEWEFRVLRYFSKDSFVLEDGLSLYCKHRVGFYYWMFRLLKARPLCYREIGEDFFVSKIYLRNPRDYSLISGVSKIDDLSKVVDEATVVSEIQIRLKIRRINSFKKTIILLGQPIDKDYKLDIQRKINLYQNIYEALLGVSAEGVDVIFKPHPRDNLESYNIKGGVWLDQNIPIELYIEKNGFPVCLVSLFSSKTLAGSCVQYVHLLNSIDMIFDDIDIAVVKNKIINSINKFN